MGAFGELVFVVVFSLFVLGGLAGNNSEDQCGKCEAGACHLISGIFTQTSLPSGYSKVTRIPRGACHVNITQIKPSANYISLKIHRGHYLLNGRWSPTSSHRFQALGTTFVYRRPLSSEPLPATEYVRARGPIEKPLDVMILHRGSNPGIWYSYKIPTNKIKANKTRDIQNDQLVSSQSSIYHALLSPSSTNLQQRLRSVNQQQSFQGGTYNQGQPARRAHLQVLQPQLNPGLPQQSYPKQQKPYYNQRGPQQTWNAQQSYLHAPQPYYIPPESQQPGIQSQQLRQPTYLQPEYSQVLGGANQRDARRAEYLWRVTGVTDCNRTCGGGFQNTTVVCVEQDNQAIVTNDNCNAATRPPVQMIPCNNAPCSPSWIASEWTVCSTTCSAGFQTRTVECKQRISDAISISVVLQRCNSEPAPPAIQDCNLDKPCVNWKVGNWSRCSVDCGRGQRSREVACNGPDGTPRAENTCVGPKPIVAEICDMGSCAKTWFHTAWDDQCSSECGEGVVKRRVHCAADDACATRNRPRDSKSCQNEIPCGGIWFTSSWSKCAVTCGAGVKRRDVSCLKKLGGGALTIVSEDNCATNSKPTTEEECLLPECEAQWFHTEWSECSTSCGSGFRTRELKCLDAYDAPSLRCDQKLKPDTRKACYSECRRTQEHQSRRHHQSSSNNDPQSCEDTYDNCQLVIQARLCPYYLQQCCRSCWRFRTS